MLPIENKMMQKQTVYLLTYHNRGENAKTEHAIIYSEQKMNRVKSSYLGQNVVYWNIQEIELPVFPDEIKELPF